MMMLGWEFYYYWYVEVGDIAKSSSTFNKVHNLPIFGLISFMKHTPYSAIKYE